MKKLNTIASIDPILSFLHQITMQGELKRKWTLFIIFLHEEQNLYDNIFYFYFVKKKKKR